MSVFWLYAVLSGVHFLTVPSFKIVASPVAIDSCIKKENVQYFASLLLTTGKEPILLQHVPIVFFVYTGAALMHVFILWNAEMPECAVERLMPPPFPFYGMLHLTWHVLWQINLAFNHPYQLGEYFECQNAACQTFQDVLLHPVAVCCMQTSLISRLRTSTCPTAKRLTDCLKENSLQR